VNLDAVWDGEWVGRGLGVLDRGGDCQRGTGSFEGEFGVYHCNQWGLCCIVVRERRLFPDDFWEDLLIINVKESVVNNDQHLFESCCRVGKCG